jgi:hypothetical protein
MSPKRAARSPSAGTVGIRRKCRTEAQLERLRRWWLDRFTVDELLEIGELFAWASVPESSGPMRL